jgi:hypothetical protein
MEEYVALAFRRNALHALLVVFDNCLVLITG